VSPVRYVNFQRFSRQYRDELQGVFSRFLDSGTYMGGPEVVEFERAFADYCGTRFAVGVANGLEALELTLRAWRIGPGDEVIVPANTAVQTALAVTHTGARVVLADVEPDTGLLDLAAVEAALTPVTRAIVPVHLYGHPVDMEPLCALAARAGVRVLEDAAHAHGAEYRARRCGSLADAAAFSFYPTKNLGAFGDAGCVTTDDAGLAEELRLLRGCGLTADYRHERRGYTSRLDPLQAALLRWKLVHLDAWNERRRGFAATYLAGLAATPGLTLPVVRPWARPVWYAFPICVHGGRRDELARALLADGIETNVHYRLPIHLQPCFADEPWRRGDYAVSELRADALVSLPLDPFHSAEEIARAIAAVRATMQRLHERAPSASLA
jgi:dTDP-4-amino-4,6-dideoxygalactose transaminase